MKTQYTFGVVLAAVALAAGSNAAISSAQEPAASAVVMAEVRDAAGQVLLRGAFAAGQDDSDDDDLEWKARLEPTGVDPDAAGSAEVEVPRSGSGAQEIEFSVRGVEPGSRLVFLIDGREVGSATADRRGRAELDQDQGSAPARK